MLSKGEDNMQVVFQWSPHSILRLMIRLYYENEMSQMNHDDVSIEFKSAMCDFISDDKLDDDYLDSLIQHIYPNTTDISIESSDKEKLWKAIAVSDKFIEHMRGCHLLDSSVYDKHRQAEYPCEFGEHCLGIVSALHYAGIDTHNIMLCDRYIDSNILIRGTNQGKSVREVLQGVDLSTIPDLRPELIIKPLDISKFILNYIDTYCMKNLEELDD